MAHQQDSSTGRQRLLTTLAVAALALAMAFAFGRVFVGRAPTWELIAAALASAGIAGLCERRGLVVALVASAAGLAFAITWVVLPQTAWYGLPTLRTLRAVGRCLEFVGQQTRVQVAPAPAFPPLMLAAVTAVWTSAFSAHALAVRAGSPLLAVLPPAALVGFADMVLEDGARPMYAVAFLAAALGLVFTDGLRRVRQWGPVWSTLRSRPLWSVSGRGARQVGTAAILVALLVPGLLPGFRSAALVDFSTGGDQGIRLDPFVSIHAQLRQREPVDLFAVTATRPAYWRLYALDRFDGLTWSSSDPEANLAGVELGSRAEFPAIVAAPEDSPVLAQRYRILRDLDGPWLPVAHPAEEVALADGSVRYQPDLNTVATDARITEGYTYSARSRVVAPTAAELDLIQFGSPERYGAYTFLPGSVDERVGEIARRWTRGEPTPFRQILAIQNHLLRDGFEYDLEVEPTADSTALLEFLTGTKRGFCQQFATAMAVLVRELGYPSRVAVGFRSGTPDGGGGYVVQNLDAHAWVEVFFPGVGWLPFEPTPGPGFSNPVASTYLNPSEGAAAGGAPGEEGVAGGQLGPGSALAEACAAVGGTAIDPRLCREFEGQGRPGIGRGLDGLPPGFLGGTTGAVGPSLERDDGYSIPYRWIALGLLAIAGLLVPVIPVAKVIARRRILRRSRDPRARVLAAYRVLDGRAADLGLGRRPGETIVEHRDRLSAAATFSDGHLDRLAAAAARAAYAESAPSGAEAAAAVRDARTVIADLRREAGWTRTLAGVYRLRR
ncbi:MAG TPA: DUF3488 and transglutaminase-like domain-containing protein [Actinomycetota bacterium]|nr:DUF3488 and transglutaminase-like domain-containing protein [Actinomycetota bacterium]